MKIRAPLTAVVKANKPLIVPEAALRRAGFQRGQELEVKASGGVITILPKLPSADDEYTPEQRRIIDARLAKGLADLRAGRVQGPFSTHKEFIDSLHKEAERIRRMKTKHPAR